MVRIRHARGGQGIGPHWWPEDDPVCDVPEELARVLLGRPEDEGFSLEPDPEPEEPESSEESEDEDDDPDDGGEENAGDQGEEKKPPAKPAARRSRAKGAAA